MLETYLDFGKLSVLAFDQRVKAMGNRKTMKPIVVDNIPVVISDGQSEIDEPSEIHPEMEIQKHSPRKNPKTVKS